MITSKESLNFQKDISDDMQAGEYSKVYGNIENKVDNEFTSVLEAIKDENFDNSVEKALATTSEGEKIYQGTATAILVDIDGNVRAFFSNTPKDNELYITFAKAAFEKATAGAFLERQEVKGGIMQNSKFLEANKYKRHDGASIPTVNIDGVEYFIGVSGAMVDEEYTRKMLKTNEAFNASGLEPEYSMWRGAGFWDFICATQIRNYINNPDTKQEIGNVSIPTNFVDKPFFD